MSHLTSKLVLILAAAISVVLAVQYLRLLKPAQARAIQAACNGLSPSASNPAIKNIDKKVIAPDFSLQDSSGKTVKLSDYRGKIVVVNFWASWCAVCRSEKPSLEQFQGDTDDVVVLALASDNNWAKVTRALLGFEVENAEDVLKDVKTYGVRNPANLSAEKKEIVVSRIDGGRAASEGGLRWLDHILSINGTAVPNLEALDRAMLSATGNFSLEVINKGKTRTVPIAKNSALRVLLDPSSDGGNLGSVAKNYGITAVPESFVVDREGKIRHYFINKRNWMGDVAATCLQDLIDE